VRSVEDHLAVADPPVRELYEQLVGAVSAVGPVSFVAVKSQINVRANSTFMGVKVRPDRLVVELLLPTKRADDRYGRVTTLSASRFAHVAEIRLPEDIDDGIMADIAEAYALGAR
jgi:hypothetical protein